MIFFLEYKNKKYEVIIDDELSYLIPFCRIFSGKNDLYVNTTFGIILHRFLLNAQKTETVDHINHNTLDNRLENLRIATRSQNGANRRSKRKIKGVTKPNYKYRENKPYRARITVNKKQIFLGWFSTKEEASNAYNTAALKYFGEFAKLNEVE